MGCSLHQQKPAWGVSHVCGATQASGEALYTLDQPVTKEGLWAAYVGSEHSLARVDAVDASKALQLPGVVAYINAEDIPEDGVNDCMGQEPVFTEGLVEYLGQPIGLIVAEDRAAAETGAQLVKVRKRVGRGWGAVARLHPSFELELAGGILGTRLGLWQRDMFVRDWWGCYFSREQGGICKVCMWGWCVGVRRIQNRVELLYWMTGEGGKRFQCAAHHFVLGLLHGHSIADQWCIASGLPKK